MLDPNNPLFWVLVAFLTFVALVLYYRGDFRRKFTLAEHGFRLPRVRDFATEMGADEAEIRRILRILDRIDALQGGNLCRRPVLGPLDWLRMLARAVRM